MDANRVDFSFAKKLLVDGQWIDVRLGSYAPDDGEIAAFGLPRGYEEVSIARSAIKAVVLQPEISLAVVEAMSEILDPNREYTEEMSDFYFLLKREVRSGEFFTEEVPLGCPATAPLSREGLSMMALRIAKVCPGPGRDLIVEHREMTATWTSLNGMAAEEYWTLSVEREEDEEDED